MRTSLSTGLLAASLLAASPAFADPCEGDHIASVPASVGADEVGRLELYFDRTDGRYCATMVHAGPLLKKAAYTRISLAACQDRLCRTVQAPVMLDGAADYLDAAGPVRLGAQGRCVIATGQIAFQGETQTVRTPARCP